jgi:hypothetical protein
VDQFVRDALDRCARRRQSRSRAGPAGSRPPPLHSPLPAPPIRPPLLLLRPLLAPRLEEEPCETLVAAGGDGTLNELVGAMVKYGAPPTVSAALVPFGTANDFAAAAGISQVRAAGGWACSHAPLLVQRDTTTAAASLRLCWARRTRARRWPWPWRPTTSAPSTWASSTARCASSVARCWCPGCPAAAPLPGWCIAQCSADPPGMRPRTCCLAPRRRRCPGVHEHCRDRRGLRGGAGRGRVLLEARAGAAGHRHRRCVVLQPAACSLQHLFGPQIPAARRPGGRVACLGKPKLLGRGLPAAKPLTGPFPLPAHARPGRRQACASCCPRAATPRPACASPSPSRSRAPPLTAPPPARRPSRATC